MSPSLYTHSLGAFPPTEWIRVVTQVLDLSSTNHGDMGVWVSLPVFSFSLHCQFHTVSMQAVTMQQLTGFHCPLLIVGGKEGHFCALQLTLLFLQWEQVEAKLSSQSLPPSPHSSTDQALAHPQRKHEQQQQQGSTLSRRNTLWQHTSSPQLSKCHLPQPTSKPLLH